MQVYNALINNVQYNEQLLLAVVFSDDKYKPVEIEFVTWHQTLSSHLGGQAIWISTEKAHYLQFRKELNLHSTWVIAVNV